MFKAIFLHSTRTTPGISHREPYRFVDSRHNHPQRESARIMRTSGTDSKLPAGPGCLLNILSDANRRMAVFMRWKSKTVYTDELALVYFDAKQRMPSASSGNVLYLTYYRELSARSAAVEDYHTFAGPGAVLRPLVHAAGNKYSLHALFSTAETTQLKAALLCVHCIWRYPCIRNLCRLDCIVHGSKRVHGSCPAKRVTKRPAVCVHSGRVQACLDTFDHTPNSGYHRAQQSNT